MEFLRNGVTGHRGDPAHFPENSLVSFKSALECGVDFIELDIHATRDSELVVVHDGNTVRTAGVEGNVGETTLDELKKLDMASVFRKERGLTCGQCPPAPILTLREVIEWIKGNWKTRISIQPKDESVDAALKLIRDLDAVPWVAFNDRSIEKMRRVKEVEPRIPVFWDRPADGDPVADLSTAQKWKFESLVVNRKGLTKEMVGRFQGEGFEVGVWTLLQPGDEQKFASWGLNRFYTNDPGKLLDSVRKGDIMMKPTKI